MEDKQNAIRVAILFVLMVFCVGSLPLITHAQRALSFPFKKVGGWRFPQSALTSRWQNG